MGKEEDKIKRKKVRAFRRTLLLSSYCAAFHVFGAVLGAMGPALPSIQRDLVRYSLSHYGAVFTSRGLGCLFGALLAASVESRFHNFGIMVGTLTMGFGCFGIVVLKSWFHDNFLALCVMAVLQGGGGGFSAVLVNTQTATQTPPDSPWLTGVHFSYSIGALIIPFIVQAWGYKVAFGILALASLIAALCPPIFGWGLQSRRKKKDDPADEAPGEPEDGEEPFLLSPGEDTSLLSPGEEGKADPAKDGADGLDSERGRGYSADSDMLEALQPLGIIPTGMLTLLFFLYLGFELGYGGWISSYVAEHHMDPEGPNGHWVAWSASIFWLGMATGRALVAGIIKWVGVAKILTGNMIGCVLSLVILTVNAGAGNSLKVLLIGTALYGLSSATLFPLTMSLPGTYALELSEKSATAFLVGASFGEMAIPMAMGFMVNKTASALFAFTLLGTLLTVGQYAAVTCVMDKESKAGRVRAYSHQSVTTPGTSTSSSKFWMD